MKFLVLIGVLVVGIFGVVIAEDEKKIGVILPNSSEPKLEGGEEMPNPEKPKLEGGEEISKPKENALEGSGGKEDMDKKASPLPRHRRYGYYGGYYPNYSYGYGYNQPSYGMGYGSYGMGNMGGGQTIVIERVYVSGGGFRR